MYRSARFDTTGTSVVLDGGLLDPDIGQSYRQIAMRGRSLHRSQDMGMLQEMGPSTIRMALREDRTGAGGSSFFAGIDTTAPPVGEGDGIEAQDQQAHRNVARGIQATLLVDAISDVGWLVPGHPVRLRLSVWNAGRKPVKARMRLIAPSGWRLGAGCLEKDHQVAPGEVVDCKFETLVPENAPFT